jgi:DNA polymerase IV
MICHMDVDAFAVSVERALDRKLVGRPVVTGNWAGGRGLVACASYEARKLGVRAGMPLARAKRRAPRAVYLPENQPAYEEHSARLQLFLCTMVPTVEAATLDDFYLDVTGCEKLFGGDLLRWTIKQARKIRAETALPVSAGIGSNKLIARLATRLAKPGNVVVVQPGQEEEFLADVPVKCLPGIGEVGAGRLQDFGINRVGELAQLDDETLTLLFGTAASAIRHHARGGCDEPVKARGFHRRICLNHVFDEDTARPEILEAAAAQLGQRLAWILRQHDHYCKHATLEMFYADGMCVSRKFLPEIPTDEEFCLAPIAREALKAAFSRRVRIRRLRLYCSYVPRREAALDLFAEDARRKRKDLVTAIDEIRERYGFNKLLFTSSLLPQGR